ncbi:MAG TPA: EamA family transporter [Steroidobacteraceae bacterium]|nr:EamA family transporter [Steroidobacteraceae bacterium]
MTAPTAAATAPLPRDSRIQLAFAVIYLVWGVTPAVNRIMVLQLPPLLAAGARFALAGAFLTALARARGLALPKGAQEWRSLAVSAVLGIVISNGLSVMALQHIASNQAALINSSCAFWLAWIGMYGRRAAPVSNRTWVGLAVGFAGVAVLLSARGLGAEAHVGWQLAILGSALAWALATAVIREAHSASDPLAFTACYLLCGGVLLLALGLAGGEASRWSWTPSGLAAIGFLAVFSSTFGFVAYTFLLMHETPSRIGTYAYVNPPVAVITGWLLLGERLGALQLAGSAIVLLGVALVRNLRLWPRRPGTHRQPR